MLGDLLAECFPLLGVPERELERPLGNPHTTGGDVDPPDLERVHHLHKPLAEAFLLTTEEVLGRNLVAVEDELRGFDALVAELFDLRGDREPVVLGGAGLLVADEAGHALVLRVGVRVGLGQHEHDTA